MRATRNSPPSSRIRSLPRPPFPHVQPPSRKQLTPPTRTLSRQSTTSHTLNLARDVPPIKPLPRGRIPQKSPVGIPRPLPNPSASIQATHPENRASRLYVPAITRIQCSPRASRSARSHLYSPAASRLYPYRAWILSASPSTYAPPQVVQHNRIPHQRSPRS